MHIAIICCNMFQTYDAKPIGTYVNIMCNKYNNKQ